MGLLQCILGCSDKTRVTSTLDRNEVNGIEAQRILDISEVADQETTTIRATKTEPNVQMGSALFSCWRRRDVCSDPCVITTDPRSISGLPDEILLNILSYFGPKDLCLIAKVCKRWNALAKNVELWKTQSYTVDFCSNITEIKEVLTNAPALDLLIIYNRDDVKKILKFLFDKRVELRRLTLSYGWNDKCAKLVDLYPDLEGLSLERSWSIGSATFGRITRLKKLSELNLFDCKELSGETIRLIADSCQHLKKLKLGKSEISDEDVLHVIDRLGKQLTNFVLHRKSLTDIAYTYLKNCPRLQELELYNCENMTDRGLLEGIGSLQELTTLHLRMGENLTAQALSTFLHRPSMTSIVELHLRKFFNLDDEGLKGIAKRCIHLKILNLHSCYRVTDAGISMVISHCSQLHVLGLAYISSITGEGWLTRVPSHLPNLRFLFLNLTRNVPYDHLDQLQAAVPELKIVQ